MGAVNLLQSALNSNVGQTLVTAGAQRAAAEIYDATGFGGEEVDSPTATVEAAKAPMLAAAEPKTATSKIPKWVKVVSGVGAVAIVSWFAFGRKKKKGGK
ncbi:MAG: hypothetical protein JXR25_03105 [Pontiellaceae bacterium]|nr:hypothetical protein [Pontiellaceae bacterium]